MSYTELTPELITSYYLYGTVSPPANLVDAGLVRPAGATVTVSVDKENYMATGAGRFALGSMSPLVTEFLRGDALSNLTPGTSYTKQQIAAHLGLGSYAINIQQTRYADEVDDYGERAYIYNSTSFQISDDARFVIHADGRREIQNFFIEPRQIENFDFEGGGAIAGIGNPYLEARVDPSGIGRKVEIEFTGDPPTTTYTLDSLLADEAKQATWSLVPELTLFSEITSILNQLWAGEIIKFLDGDRAIVYAKPEGGVIEEAIAYKDPFLRPYLPNGIVFVGLNGVDTIRDTVGADVMLGGAGQDIADFSHSAVDATLGRGTYSPRNGNDIDALKLTVAGRSGFDLIAQVETVKLGTWGDTIKIVGPISQFAGLGQIEFIDGTKGGAKDVLDLSGLTETGVSISGGDTFSLGQLKFTQFEKILGSASEDVINLSSANNAYEIIGGAGNDTIITGAGADTLKGGEGDDTLDGGSGNDTFVLEGAFGQDTIVRLEAGDVIKVNGSVLTGGEREEESGEPYRDAAGNRYIWTGSGPLTIRPAGGGSILVPDFKNGDGGIHLEEMDDPDEGEPPTALPRPVDPLVLDRDGDGVELMPIGAVTFDLTGDGLRERVGWVSPDDAFLARDLNGNGSIDNISELYGSATQTGFDALSLEDTNGDGIVDAQDAGWSHMRVWQDVNSNGITDAGELLTMEQAQIRSIALAHQDGSWSNNGNTIIEQGSYTSTGGTLYQAASALFQADLYRTQVEIPAGFEYPDEIRLLPDLNGTGQVADLSYAMALDPELAAAARALITGAATMSASQFRAGFEALLFKWAGLEGLDPAARGAYVDARHITFAEKIIGTPYTFGGGSNPNQTQGANVEAFYRILVDSLIVRFAAQVGPCATFLAENPEEGLAHPFWAFASLLYDRDTGVISGKIGWTVAAIVNKAPPEPADQVAHFERMMPLVRALLAEFASATPQNVQAALSTLEDKALAKFAFEVVSKSSFVGTDGADAVTTPSSKASAILYGGHGDDTLTGSSSSADTYVYAAGSGHDTITNSGGTSGSDTLLLIGLRPADVTAQANVPAAGDIRLVFAGGGSLVLKGYATSLVIDEIMFADGTVWTPTEVHNAALAALGTAGADTITGYGTANVIDGKQGHDLLSGGMGGDTYLIRSGDGQDTIDDNGSSSYSAGSDRIHFLDRASTGFTLTRSGNDAILTFAGSSDSIIIKNQFVVGSADEIEQLLFADGVTVTAADLRNLYLAQLTTAGSDTINGFAASDDVIRGGLGNDTLDGSSSADLYLWQAGDGNDVINDTGSSANDKLRLEGVHSSQVTIVRVGLDAHVRIGSETIVLKNQFASSGANVIERIAFSDGAWSASEIAFRAIWPVSDVPSLIGTSGNETLLGTSGNNGLAGMGGTDTLKGGSGSDTYFWAPGDGSDVIEDIGGSSAIDADVLKLNGQPAGFLISRVGNNLILRCLATGETLTLVNQFTTSTKAIERIVFTDGTIWQEADIAAQAALRGTDGHDVVTGTSGDDRIDGGAGNDTLKGGAGSDTYVFGPQSGNDIIEESWEQGLDRVVLAFARDAIEFLRSGDQLIIRVIATGQTLTDALHYAYGDEGGIEEFVFADGTTLTKLEVEALALVKGTDAADALQGGYGNDTILGGLGDDTLLGGYGSDTYLWRLGDGSDWILDQVDYDSPSIDTLRLIGVDPDSVTLSHASGSLLITLASGEVITIASVFEFEYSFSARIMFDDGTVWDRDLILHTGARLGTDGDDCATGGALDDLIAGDGGYDYLNGGLGDDTVRGGSGSDCLLGDAGNDLIQGGADGDWLDGGDGDDHLKGEAGADTLSYSRGNDTLEGGEGDDAYIIDQYDHIVTIREGAASGGEGDGLFMTSRRDSDFDFRREGDDLIIASLHSNHVTRVENHFLTDGSGLEFIRFGLDGGYDWNRAMIEMRVVHGPTVKLITGTALSDALQGDWGANTIKGYGGNDTLTGGGGNDTLEGGAGDDLLMGGIGSDTYRYTDLSGSDTIVDEDGPGDEDLFEIKVLEASAFTFTRSGDDLLLQNLATGQITTFVDQFLGDGSGIEAIRFAADASGSGGYIWDRSMIEAQVLGGSASSHNGDWP